MDNIAAISSFEAPRLSLSDTRDLIQHLCGRMKTLAEAAISDPAQCKAVKDVIHSTMWSDHWMRIVTWADSVDRFRELNPEAISRDEFPFRTSHQLPQ